MVLGSGQRLGYALTSHDQFFSKMLFKNGPTRPLFVYFCSFQTQILQKNCMCQLDSNTERQSRRKAYWPLDHHHGPIKTATLHVRNFQPRSRHGTSIVAADATRRLHTWCARSGFNSRWAILRMRHRDRCMHRQMQASLCCCLFLIYLVAFLFYCDTMWGT